MKQQKEEKNVGICLWPYHPEHAQSPLISEAKEGWACQYLRWENVGIYQSIRRNEVKEKYKNEEGNQKILKIKKGRSKPKQVRTQAMLSILTYLIKMKMRSIKLGVEENLKPLLIYR